MIKHLPCHCPSPHDRRSAFCQWASQYPVVLPLVFLVAGILAGRYLPALRPWPAVGFGICAGLVVFAVARGKPIAWLFACALFFFGWVSMARFVSPVIDENHLLAHVDGSIHWLVTGTVDSDPEITGNRQVFLLAVGTLADGDRVIPINGRLRVTIYDAFEKFAFGTGLRFYSRLRPMRNFANPGAFDYHNYMAYQNVFGTAYAPVKRVTRLEETPAPTFRHAIETLRAEIAAAIDKSTAKDPAGVLKALVVGKKNNITLDVQNYFIRAGVAHLLAISGLHIGIVATVAFAFFSWVFSFIPVLLWNGWVKKSAAVAALVLVVMYGAIAGMSPSTQRAVIMVAVFLMAFVVQRTPRLINTLALAALIILLVHPPDLFAVSFQLSFVAVFFIVCGMAVTQAPVARIHRRPTRIAVSFLLVSAFAIAGTLPLTMHYFNQASLAGLMSNCILVPLVGFIAVPLGLAGAIAHMLWPAAGTVLFAADGALVSVGIAVARGIAGLPFAAVYTITPSILEMTCYYAMLLSALAFVKNRLAPAVPDTGVADVPDTSQSTEGSPFARYGPQIVFAVSLLVLLLDAGWWAHYRFLHKDLRITILDVGQGNAAVAELPRGKVVLIDGGGFAGSATFNPGEKVVAPFLWRNKITGVDIIIATHPDTDHIGGLAFIAETFGVKQLWSNGQAKETEDYRALMDAVKRHDIAMPGYDTLAGGRAVNGVIFEFLYPPNDFAEKSRVEPWRDTNNNSLVTRISMDAVSFLFPGDISKNAENELAALAGDRLASTVLIVPHHGSKTSSTPAFANRVRPEAVVFSAGAHNRYGYPHPEVVERYAEAGARVYRTDRDGAVIIRTHGHGWFITTPCAP